MDRRVKERLVGASILVVLIVLIVPELLSGPAPAPVAARLPASAPEPARNVTVDLRTSKAQATALDVAPDPAASSADGPSAAAPSTAAPSTAAPNTAAPSAGAPSAAESGNGASNTPGPSTETPAAAPAAPVEIAAPHPTSGVAAGKPAKSGHAWAVQLGSFASHENADKLVRHLKAQGFAVYVAPGGSGSSLRYRVRIGPMADRGAATETVAKLKSQGQVASLVPPAP